MPEASLKAVIGADVAGFVSGMQTAANTIGGLQNKIKELRASRLEIADPAQLAAVNQEIASVTANLKQLKNVDREGFDEVGLKIKLPTPE